MKSLNLDSSSAREMSFAESSSGQRRVMNQTSQVRADRHGFDISGCQKRVNCGAKYLANRGDWGIDGLCDLGIIPTLGVQPNQIG